MNEEPEWSPDESLGTETFEQDDEALDEDARTDPTFVEDVDGDPSLAPRSQGDEREREALGTDFDDPQEMVVLDGGIDDPDGLGQPSERARSPKPDEDGWDLDAPIAGGDDRGEASLD